MLTHLVDIVHQQVGAVQPEEENSKCHELFLTSWLKKLDKYVASVKN